MRMLSYGVLSLAAGTDGRSHLVFFAAVWGCIVYAGNAPVGASLELGGARRRERRVCGAATWGRAAIYMLRRTLNISMTTLSCLSYLISCHMWTTLTHSDHTKKKQSAARSGAPRASKIGLGGLNGAVRHWSRSGPDYSQSSRVERSASEPLELSKRLRGRQPYQKFVSQQLHQKFTRERFFRGWPSFCHATRLRR